MTGADDINNLRKIKDISGETSIRANQSYFNGNTTTYKIFNPWKKDVPVSFFQIRMILMVSVILDRWRRYIPK
jgi:hypothetical protein